MLAELRNRRTDLLVKFRSDDRLVQEIDQQITDTAAALDRARSFTAVEETTDVNPLCQSLEAELSRAELSRAGFEARKTSLAATLASWRSRMATLDGATAQHDTLTRQAREAEGNLLLYTKKQEEARIADSLDQQKFANVSIAEAPVQPYLPDKPNVPLNLALGFLLACFTSLGAAFALEMNRSSFDSPAELEFATKLPVLAAVPAEGA
jgi:uncharacterized protein involved in exopolysaccharide biosynthesis